MKRLAFSGLGVGLAIGFALLPGRVLFWAIPVVSIGAIIYVVVRWLFRSEWGAVPVLALGTLLFVLVVSGGAYSILVGLLLLFLSSWIVIAVYPTVINFGLSYLAVQLLPDKRIIRIAGFMLISLVLAFNVRIPGMLYDWFGDHLSRQMEVKKVIKLSQDVPLLLVSNADQISFRASPDEPISLGGNEGCMCFYWVYPRMIRTKGGLEFNQRA